MYIYLEFKSRGSPCHITSKTSTMKTLKNTLKWAIKQWSRFEKFMEPYGKAAAYAINR